VSERRASAGSGPRVATEPRPDGGASVRRAHEITVARPADELTAARRADELPDAHHSTLLAASGGARSAASGPVSDLHGYMERVADLQRDGRLFEKLEIEINLGCNRRCTYCNLATDRREDYVQTRRRTMDWSLFELLVRQLEEVGFDGVLCFHFYAEPLLNRRLGEYVAHAKRHLPAASCIIYSNGDYLTAERHRKLTAAGVSLFFVTRHDNLIPDSLAPVLSEPNVLLDTRAEMTFNSRAGLLGPPVDPRVRTLPCIYTSETLIVTIDGNVLPCSCDFREMIRFGNIRDLHIRDIYASDACRRFRQDLLAGRREEYALCRDCDFYCEVLGVRSSAESHRRREQPTVVQIRRATRRAEGDG
jgi:radical SAM protein with 4Fe4S-binding SPASM domain